MSMNYVKILDICGLVVICLVLIYSISLSLEAIHFGIVPVVIYAALVFLGPSQYKGFILAMIITMLAISVIFFAVYVQDILLIIALGAVSIRASYLSQSKQK